MGDCKILAYPEQGILYKADSGALNFQVKASPSCSPEITFYAKLDPSLKLYKIILSHQTRIFDLLNGQECCSRFPFLNANFLDFQELWLTWHSEKILLGEAGQSIPFLSHKLHKQHLIGYIHFNTSKSRTLDWIFETSPVIVKPISPKKFSDRPCWTRMIDDNLPHGAMIGGFENEPIYIARAYHNHAICPGKYVKSRNLAFIPWGHREHAKQTFEILCGYNAQWVKTKSNIIPINAIIGGSSERNEPLYIGRAMHEGNLLTGKVHVFYKTCYLPYKGKEIEVSDYEILVLPDNDIPQAMFADQPTRPILRTSDHVW